MGKGRGAILDHRDLLIAKEVLKRKFVVGLFQHMEESFERFEAFFGWNVGASERTCQENKIGRVMEKHFNSGQIPSAALAPLEEKNRLDMELYDFAVFLFDYQGRVLFGKQSVEYQSDSH